jgi:ligand-binding sensor domain-containing protein
MFSEINSFAQSGEIRFDRISIEDGLSQSSVLSITQDKFGFMWFATLDGLNKYDGFTFTVYRHNPLDTNSISDLGIRKVFTDSKNNLWVITLGGKLDRFDENKNIFKHYKFGKQQNSRSERIIAYAETSDGNLWLGAMAGNLYLYQSDYDIYKPVKSDPAINTRLSKIHLQSLCCDDENNIWLGTWEGLLRFNPDTENITWFRSSGTTKTISGNLIMNLHKDSNGNIWAAITDGGVSEFVSSSEIFKNFRSNKFIPGSLSSNRIMSIYFDKNSNLWAGTVDAGLNLLTQGKKSFSIYKNIPSNEASIGNGAIMSIFEDKCGGLWFGTSSGGVSRFDLKNQKFVNISHDADDNGSLNQNTILSIMKDSRGRLWVGTDGGGLDCRLPGEKNFKHYLHSTNYGSNSITAVFEDSKGTIWAASDPGVSSVVGGIYVLERNSNRFHPFSKIKLKIGGIQTILEDDKKNIWFGSNIDGLWRYNLLNNETTAFRHDVNDKSSIAGNAIFVLYKGRTGKIWIGTQNSGLSCYNFAANNFINFKADPIEKDSLSNNSIWSICEDSTGNLWLGTWGTGLDYFDVNKKIFKHFTTTNGLPSNVICNILPDNSGNLWIGTNNGLSKFNPGHETFVNYFQADGLQSNEFNQGAAFRDKNGFLYFGGINGITVFNPDNITFNRNIPEVRITQFYVNNSPLVTDKLITTLKEITLEHDQNFFTIEFAALDYTAPKKNQYTYYLKGIDKEWIKSGTRRRAYYTDIAPGRYTFLVKGSNNDGIWNPKPTSLSIIIKPPFWQTWWFTALIVIGFLFILYSIHKYRINKLLEIERARLRIAKDLHDDVSGTLTGIVYFSEAISEEVGKEKSPHLEKLLSLIQESTSEVQEAMHDIIWSINPENDKWEIILPKFRRYASDLCESKGISYNINIPESIPGKPLKMEMRRNLWLIFKEMVTNAVRHSGCSILNIDISVSDDEFRMVIQDNGKGFQSSIITNRNGVKNIKSRAASIKGNLKLETSIGNGTKWKLSFLL